MRKRFFMTLLSATSLLCADTLLLRNGSSINGKFVGGDDRVIRFAVGGQVNTYDLADIDSLRLSPGQAGYSSNGVPPPPQYNAPVPPNYNNSAPISSSQAHPPDNYSAPGTAPTGSGPMQMEIPAGTELSVRLIDPADSKYDSLGKTYRASVEQPIVLNGQTVIPRGADAVAVLSEAQQSGKIQGKTTLTLVASQCYGKRPNL